ncbi:MAG: CCA tRNA nucleotidyltransferase [Terracidiphilus sp.]|jgi:tRNA nucleotidyltransferase/poly(A) polymerase
MPDFIYLLENRLSADQRHALLQLRDVAREAGVILFLTGDAVRDLTSGHAVRDLEVAVHGNALKLKKPIEKVGGKLWGEDEASRSIYVCFPGSVRVDVVSTRRAEYPKPGKPVFHAASIQEDLRRRDFTANAMAISLNEGSYGLLMDPLNGAADIEARTLRLVSNYGFLEEPALLIRATRYRTRLGWDLDPRTQSRYENAKEEGVIEHLSAHARSYELEQIGHEDDGLKVLTALEAEGWMKALFPPWTAAKADDEKLKALHDLQAELQMQGVHPDMSAAQMQLLTAKMPSKDVAALKKLLLRPGFVEEWDSLDSLASGFSKVLLAKPNLTPSASFKLFTSYDPKAVLWLGFTATSAAVKERYELFLKVWPEAKQRIPYALMQEMRITPDLPTYNEIVHKIFLELIDGRLTTPEETRAFLEPHSPPAPPPQITIKRSRAKRGAEAKVKERSFDDEDEAGAEEEADLDDIGGDDEEIDLGIPKLEMEVELGDDVEADEDEGDAEAEDEEEAEPTPKRGKTGAAPPKAAKGAAQTAVPKSAKEAAKQAGPKSAHPEKVATKPEPKAPAKAIAASSAPAAKPPIPAAKGKQQPAPVTKKAAPAPTPVKPAKPVAAPKPAAKKVAAKSAAKPPAKAVAKVKAKVPAKHAPAKAAQPKKKPAPKPAKPAPKKPASKSAKKR